MIQKFTRLTATSYRAAIGDTTKLTKKIILTPIPWIAKHLAQNTSRTEWKSNKAIIYPRVRFGRRMLDIVNCLPAASMALITMEEAIAAGTRDITFIGTAASVDGKIGFGQVRIGGRVASVLNPFEEHEKWQDINRVDLVDMEVKFLEPLAKKRGVSFRSALIVTDAIWHTRWEHANYNSREYHKAIEKSVDILRQWLHTC